jgi:hypothetical protein
MNLSGEFGKLGVGTEANWCVIRPLVGNDYIISNSCRLILGSVANGRLTRAAFGSRPFMLTIDYTLPSTKYHTRGTSKQLGDEGIYIG